MSVTLPSLDVLRQVAPELILVLGMGAVLLMPFVRRSSKTLPAWAAGLTLLAALVSVFFTLGQGAASVAGASGAVASGGIFSGLLVVDPFSQFFKALLLLFSLLVLGQWTLFSRRHTHAYDTPDFLCLLLGAVFGMALMASANHLLMIFVAMEAASYPSYVLAGFRHRSAAASEAAIKYVIFGSASSAVMLYGMSLLYGAAGGLGVAQVAQAAATHLSPLMALGLLCLLAGLAFKLSAVPLHFWCPDVFQGAPIEVTTFLSVASKGAAICLLARLAQSLGAANALPGATPVVGLTTIVAIMGAVTATWGNLVAFHQRNIKRLLAYSSIAHAGYMMMAVALLTIAHPGAQARTLLAAVLFYLAVYLFMNLGAFTVAAAVAQRPDPHDESGEDLASYTGLFRRSPLLAVLMIAFLLSLFGMPGLGGFMSKIYLATAMVPIGKGTGYLLVGVLFLNTLLSLYVYLKPVRYMLQAPPQASAHAPGAAAARADDAAQVTTPVTPIPVALWTGVILTVCLVGVLWTGILPGAVADLTHDYAVVSSAPATAQALSAITAAAPAPAPQAVQTTAVAAQAGAVTTH